MAQTKILSETIEVLLFQKFVLFVSRPIMCIIYLLSSCEVTASIPINLSALQDVFRATVVAKVTYCAPAWSGTCSAANRVRLDSFLNRCKQEAKLSRG